MHKPETHGRLCLQILACAVSAFAVLLAAVFSDPHLPTLLPRLQQRDIMEVATTPSPTQEGSNNVAATPSPKRASFEHLRVLIFITTQFSGSHKKFLERCWPSLLNNSVLVQHADVMFFTATAPPPGMFSTIFPKKNVTVKEYQNPGYQRGSMLAMEQGLSLHWFSGYDWVVRVNPDVLILDDEWLIKTMLDNRVGGIFVDCIDKCKSQVSFCSKGLVNSDFFAFRVSEMPSNAFTRFENLGNAERQATAAFRHIVAKGRDRWLPGTQLNWICRVRGRSAPVVHAHSSLLKQCPLKKGEPKDRNVQ